MLSTLHAEPTPQDIYTQLAAPAQQVPLVPEKRVEKLPALAYLPPNGDMIVATADAGQCTLELMRLLGEKPTAELERSLSSIRSSALAAGVGSASTLEQLLPILMQHSQKTALQEAEKMWSEHAEPTYADAIHKAFAKQLKLQQEHALSTYEQFRFTPVYYAVTAIPGREEDFQTMHRDLLQAMQQAAQQNPDLKYEQMGPFAGLRISQLSAYKWLMKRDPEDSRLSQAMAQRELHLLTAQNGSAAIFILCERPGDIDLPEQPEFSMLYSQKLNGANAHIDNLLATAWISSAFSRVLHRSLQSDRFPAARAAIDALRAISAQDAKQQATYDAAVQGIVNLVWQPPFFDEIQKPFTLQVWQHGKKLCMESVSDACGMDFAPGHLQLVEQSVSPQTIFYMESTAFSAPHPPNPAAYWESVSTSALNITKGLLCTLQEKDRNVAADYIRFTELFLPEIQALGSAMQTLGSGLGSPFALLAAQEKSDQGELHTDWAFFATVRDRQGLKQSWQELLATLGRAAGKLGIPPMLVSALPVSTQKLSDEAVAHSIDLPGAKAKALPKVALSNSRFVMGNSDSYNAKLIAAPNADMPFQGAVNSIDLPRLAAALDRADCTACCADSKQKVTAFMHRLAERVQRLFTTSTISNNTRTARGLMLMK